MSGINSGILRNASPLSATQIKEVEEDVILNNKCIAYLDENNQICFAQPHDPEGIKRFAWHNAHELFEQDSSFIKKVYTRTGLDTFILDKVLEKDNIEGSWKEQLTPSEGLAYTLNSDGASYSVKKGTCTDTDIVIAAEYDGLPVTSIGDYAFLNYSSLTSIEIPDSVTSIGANAFSYCSSLTSIVIPNSVTNIGASAFFRCGTLKILCEAKSEPAGWHSTWNCSNLSVTWGYTGE